MIQNNRTGYPRTGGSFQCTIGGTLQYPEFFIFVSQGSKGYINTSLVNLSAFRQTILEACVRNIALPSPCPFILKPRSHLAAGWMITFRQTSHILLCQDENLRLTGHFCFGLSCRRLEWLGSKNIVVKC